VTWAEVVWSKVLTAEAEQALQPGQSFYECADCPWMVVVPAGEFMMGSPKEEEGHQSNEEPQHKVSIRQRFAFSRFEVTFEEWDACVTLGGCAYQPSDQGWGRGTRPVINVNWVDAHQFVAWLSTRTGKSYRLLSEAEWEYAARAGSDKSYSWGDEIGRNNANCNGCGSQWDNKQTAPVGSFALNKFGLHDMHGNVWEWVEDCWHPNYQGAPNDGSAWTARGNCEIRVVRGGSWSANPQSLRAADRGWNPNRRQGLQLGLPCREDAYPLNLCLFNLLGPENSQIRSRQRPCARTLFCYQRERRSIPLARLRQIEEHISLRRNAEAIECLQLTIPIVADPEICFLDFEQRTLLRIGIEILKPIADRLGL
jgi:formylglycine-generating enzyme required for sulfatase activity